MKLMGPGNVRIGALLGLGIIAGGCATTGSDGGRVAGNSSSRATDCVFSSSVRGYTTLDDQNLILDGPGNRAYHVILTSRSMNIENEFAIGVIDRDGDGRICPFGRDRIFVDGPLPEEFSIRSIEAIDDDQAEALKIRFGVIREGSEAEVTVTDIEVD